MLFIGNDVFGGRWILLFVPGGAHDGWGRGGRAGSNDKLHSRLAQSPIIFNVRIKKTEGEGRDFLNLGSLRNNKLLERY